MKKYLTPFILILVTEIAIAIFHFHRFVRGFLGDVLVIPLLYCFLKMVTPYDSKKILYAVLSIALTVELFQLGFSSEILSTENRLLQTIIGTTFDFRDLVAYAFGIIPVLLIDKYLHYGKN